jgi:hypothetical protein
VDFTRQPIIESIITAKEGCKLVVRSSKGAGQEEYFVDAVEVVSFGTAFFFRSLEKPKSFLVPATDYEVLEVREARMVLKNVGQDRSIKIGTGRDIGVKSKEVEKEETVASIDPLQARPLEKKRERRRSYKRRRGGKDDTQPEMTLPETEEFEENAAIGEEIVVEETVVAKKENKRVKQAPVELSSSLLKSLLVPPPVLISDTIDKYKENELFKSAFFEPRAEKEGAESSEGESKHSLEDPDYDPFNISDKPASDLYESESVHTFEEEEFTHAPLEDGLSGSDDFFMSRPESKEEASEKLESDSEFDFSSEDQLKEQEKENPQP